MGQTGSGEYGELLTSDEGVQSVDGGNAGLNELCGICSRSGVHGQTVYVTVRLGKYLRTVVDGLTHSVKDTAEHILGNAQLQRVTQKTHSRLGKVYALCGLEKLNDGSVTVYLKHLAAADLAVGQLKLRQLVVGDALNVIDYHEGACYLSYGFILFNHASSPPAIA